MFYKKLTSPNYNARAEDASPDMLILHYTGMRSAQDALERLCDPASQVSCHYVIDEAGKIYALVDEKLRAWHAGVSLWKGRRDINSYSIGIELVNPGHEWGYSFFPDSQIEALIFLCKDIATRYTIPNRHFLAHSDISPNRKQDPGEKFPWAHLARNGFGLWTDPHPVGGGRYFQKGDEGQPIEALQGMLAIFGYDITINGIFDDQTEFVVMAFQRHYRPEKVDGIADDSTIISLRNIILISD